MSFLLGDTSRTFEREKHMHEPARNACPIFQAPDIGEAHPSFAPPGASARAFQCPGPSVAYFEGHGHEGNKVRVFSS